MRQFLVVICTLSAACGALQDGTYLVAVTDVSQNTCPFADEELVNVGTVDVFVFSDSISMGDLFLYRDGDYLSASVDYTSDRLDPCFVKEDRRWDGTILANDSMFFSVTGDIYTEGDCSQVDTTGIPCSYDMSVSAVRSY